MILYEARPLYFPVLFSLVYPNSSDSAIHGLGEADNAKVACIREKSSDVLARGKAVRSSKSAG